MSRKLMMGVIVLFMSVVLAACGGNDDTESDSNTNKEDNSSENSEMDEESDHSDMDPSSSGEVPDDLAKAEDPKYPVDSEAEITADHMEGMKGAIGTIEGAYDTTAYVVTYEPTDGGEKVENHKWVVHEEIENEEGQPYEQGDEVVLEADHMEGMEGATAKIDSAEDTTVYMVSYEDTDTGEEVKNHKWVTEDELSEVK
ncbi:DUF1541 domain-containing protein [Lentibacillus salinarum]|uniref:DUF1541 domain-containing protein n=1 Tax=Lentibacillus salinarum TaxID=446820 RepID=A0ABW3ZWK8_9BACI